MGTFLRVLGHIFLISITGGFWLLYLVVKYLIGKK
jgi:hypothetical protein